MASIDVAVPCYQYERFLRDSVGSILRQGVDNLRVLIIDNASTDNSVEVALQLASEDARVSVCAHPTNLGSQVSYNEAIDWASADYFMIVDADDVLAPGCLARSIAVLEQHPNAVLACGHEQTLSFAAGEPPPCSPDDGEASWTIVPSQAMLEELFRDVTCVATTTIVRRTDVQKKIGYFRKEVLLADDLEMWLRLAAAGDIARTNATQAIRRLHGDRLTEAYQRAAVYYFVQRHIAFASFFKHEGSSMPNAKHLQRQVRSKLAKEALWFGLDSVKRGQEKRGARLVDFALQLAPAVAAPRLAKGVWQLDRPLNRLAGFVKASVVGALRGTGGIQFAEDES